MVLSLTTTARSMPSVIMGDRTDDYNTSLPAVVRQLLQMSGDEDDLADADRYGLNWRYYRNQQYDADFLATGTNVATGKKYPISSEAGAAEQVNKHLWGGIKPLFDIATIAVNVDRSRVFKNARPITLKRDDKLEDRLTEKWEQYQWRRRVKLAPFYGAIMGNARLRVIPGDLNPNTPNLKSRVAVYSPEVMTVLRNQHHIEEVTAAKIEYQYTERSRSALPRVQGVLGGAAEYLSIHVQKALGLNPDEDVHVYTMIITPEEYFTFRDHKLHVFNRDLGAFWPNSLGMVPVVDVPFIDTGERTGMATFEAMIPTLDAINELATMFGQVIKMHADPPVLAYGFSNKTKFTKKLLADGSTVWYIPYPPQFVQGAQVLKPEIKYLEWSGSNFGPLLSFLEMAKTDAASVMPEYAFQMQGSQTRHGSGFEANLSMTPLDDKLGDVRTDSFDAVELALQMALVADDADGETLSTDEAWERLQEAKSKYDCTIQADPILPQSRTELAQALNALTTNKTISRQKARIMIGMSYKEAEQEEEQMTRESELDIKRATALAEATAKVAAANAPPASTVGQAISGGKKVNPISGRGQAAKTTTPARKPNPASGAGKNQPRSSVN